MAANEFSKEERVAFEDILEGFQDALVLSRNVSIYRGLSETENERSDDTIWRPMPYILQSYDGADQSSNFDGVGQLSVPSTVGYDKSVPWEMTAVQLRDALQQNRLGEAAKIRLASDINVAVMNKASLEGTLVVKRTGAATGFNDIAECDTMMNEQGIQSFMRYYAASSGDYNAMAGNLASRQTVAGKVLTAYERAYVDNISSFDMYKMDYSYRLTAAAGSGITMDTQAAANNYYVPRATSTATSGEKSNVDNRYQQITVSSTTNVKEGDCFTVAGIVSMHHIAKQATGNLKTYRVKSVDSGTTMTISPPIISNQGSSRIEEQYQNCEVTESATAAITFLNTADAQVNPFWYKDAIELRPSTIASPSDAGAQILRATTDQGIEVVFQKQYDIKTRKTLYRTDCRFGVNMMQPEMAGIEIFNQI